MKTDDPILAAYAETFCQLLAVAFGQVLGLAELLARQQLASVEHLNTALHGIPEQVLSRLVEETRQEMQAKVAERIAAIGGYGNA